MGTAEHDVNDSVSAVHYFDGSIRATYPCLLLTYPCADFLNFCSGFRLAST